MVKVCFHAFLAPTVDFNPKKDELYVVFGPKRNDWNPQKEGLMNFIGTKKYFIMFYFIFLINKSMVVHESFIHTLT